MPSEDYKRVVCVRSTGTKHFTVMAPLVQQPCSTHALTCGSVVCVCMWLGALWLGVVFPAGRDLMGEKMQAGTALLHQYTHTYTTHSHAQHIHPHMHHMHMHPHMHTHTYAHTHTHTHGRTRTHTHLSPVFASYLHPKLSSLGCLALW